MNIRKTYTHTSPFLAIICLPSSYMRSVFMRWAKKEYAWHFSCVCVYICVFWGRRGLHMSVSGGWSIASTSMDSSLPSAASCPHQCLRFFSTYTRTHLQFAFNPAHLALEFFPICHGVQERGRRGRRRVQKRMRAATAADVSPTAAASTPVVPCTNGLNQSLFTHKRGKKRRQERRRRMRNVCMCLLL